MIKLIWDYQDVACWYVHLAMVSDSVLDITCMENRSSKLVKKIECSFAEIKKGWGTGIKSRKMPAP